MASLEEADALLRKWNINESQIFCTSVLLGRAASSLRGVIVQANSEGFTIANSLNEKLVVRFFQVTEFKIENPGKGQPVVSTLRLSLEDGSEITFNEEKA